MAAVINGNVQAIQIGAKSRPAVDVANLILMSGFACPITGVEAEIREQDQAELLLSPRVPSKESLSLV